MKIERVGDAVHVELSRDEFDSLGYSVSLADETVKTREAMAVAMGIVTKGRCGDPNCAGCRDLKVRAEFIERGNVIMKQFIAEREARRKADATRIADNLIDEARDGQ